MPLRTLAAIGLALLALLSPLSADPPARADPEGFPLPEGAKFRLGSAHWRHGEAIGDSVLSPDGNLLASTSRMSVAVWDLSPGKIVRRFPYDSSRASDGAAVAFSPDGARLGCVRNGLFLHLWDLSTGRELWRDELRR